MLIVFGLKKTFSVPRLRAGLVPTPFTDGLQLDLSLTAE